MTLFADNNGIKIAYETLGNPANPTIIFISGLGSQLLFWSDEFCQHFLDRRFHIIRFDNRDVGLSHKTPGTPPTVEALMADPDFKAPYTLSDMAADTIAVLDAVGVDQAHVFGTSLGGMIAQTVAINHPERVATLTSVMSAPSRSDALRDESSNEAVNASLTVDLSDPETYVDLQVEGWRVTSGPHFDEIYQRKILQESFDRCYHPAGWSYQMLAVTASGDRTAQLGQLSMPALVIHGALDSLIPPISGQLTADAIPNANLLILEDMGHNIPRPYWGKIADAVKALATV